MGTAPQAAAKTEQADTPTHKAASRHDRDAAENAYLAGAHDLERDDIAGAEAEFGKAQRLNPGRSEYNTAMTVAREHHLTSLVQQAGKARILGQSAQADALLAEARRLDPGNTIVTQHAAPEPVRANFFPQISPGGPEDEVADAPWIRERPALAGPIELRPEDGVRSFHIRSDIQGTLQQVLSAYGIRAVFDESVTHQEMRFDLADVRYAQAVPMLLRLAGLFAVPLEAKTVLVARDTTENRDRFERQLQETIYVPGSSVEQMTELGNLVRTVFDVKQATVRTTAGNLVLRAPADTLNAINLTLADLIDGGSEVVIELRLYSVDKTRNRNIGLSVPQQFGVYNVASQAQSLVSSNQSLVDQAIAQGVIPADASVITIALYLLGSGLVQSSLLSNTVGFFGNGLTLTGLTQTGGVNLNLGLNSSDTRALDDIQVRVGDRQAAVFRAGSRYPITTATYSTGSPVSSASLAGININGVSASSLLSQYLGNTNSVTVPQIQYEDLGVTLKTTPKVQKTGEVNMHLDLKIEALAGAAINNIPILASRQVVSDVTVGDGETALLVSSLSKTESAAVSGLPGLGELPGFQAVTADRIAERDTSELVLLITPHVVRRRSSALAGPRIAFNAPAGTLD